MTEQPKRGRRPAPNSRAPKYGGHLVGVYLSDIEFARLQTAAGATPHSVYLRGAGLAPPTTLRLQGPDGATCELTWNGRGLTARGSYPAGMTPAQMAALNVAAEHLSEGGGGDLTPVLAALMAAGWRAATDH